MSRWLLALWIGLTLNVPFSANADEEPAILLANVYRNQVDVTQYLVSEKLDGVRAVWDGRRLRIGRGSFERVSGIVRKETPIDAEWHHVRYMIFELPGAPGSFRQRVDQISQLVHQANVPWLQRIDQATVSDLNELQQWLATVLDAGGEGLMLHRADAVYETGRSDTLLKLKPWLDAEAEVIGHRAGKGRHTGRLGALQVRTPEGKTFLLGTGFSDAQRQNPPPIGARVTYRYRELTRTGLPRFASFLRVRED